MLRVLSQYRSGGTGWRGGHVPSLSLPKHDSTLSLGDVRGSFRRRAIIYQTKNPASLETGLFGVGCVAAGLVFHFEFCVDRIVVGACLRAASGAGPAQPAVAPAFS